MTPRAIDRRRFLRLSTAALPLAAGCRRRRPPAPDVVVVGAGLAGLRAAELLREAGREVVVLEAQGRPGGRVRTLRAPLDEELHGEAGAIRIPDRHQAVRALANRQGLSLIPFESGNGASVISVAGQVVRVPGEIDRLAHVLSLRRDERGLSPRALLLRYAADIPANLADPAAGVDAYRQWSAIDGMSWPAWLASRGASPGAVTLMSIGGDSRELSALYVLRQFAMLRDVKQYYKILGGMDQLPAAMAQDLGSIVRYNAAVVRVEQEDDGVTLGYVEGERSRTVRARRVILTVPLTIARQLDVRPAFSPAKTAIVRTLPYFPATRALLQTRTRFWHQERLSGSSRSDRPAETWDAAYEQPADRGLLAATVGGALGRELASLDEPAAVERMYTVAAAPFPAIREAFEKGVVYRWATDRWAQGAFAVFYPGQMSAMTPEIARPEGRVHFAGEHTSAWMGWMEGAIESGERAAREVLAAA
jgi:monoamine oxidase